MSDKAALNATQANNDQAWTHYDLAATLLELSVVQIKHAMADNDESMMALAEAHQAIGSKLQAIATALTSTQASEEAEEDTHSNINKSLGQMIMAFQGHDALNQRLEHVCETLQGIQGHIGEESRRHDEQAWNKMVDSIGRSYTMEDERAVFRQVTGREDLPANGASDNGGGDDIELF